jgi:hypothetical protein
MIYTVILFPILRQTRPTILCHEHYDTLNTQHSFVEHQETQIRFKILTISTKMAVFYSTSIIFFLDTKKRTASAHVLTGRQEPAGSFPNKMLPLYTVADF